MRLHEMLKQLFRYRKIELVLESIPYKVTIPNYKCITYMVVDKDGSIYVFDHEPIFNKKSKLYESKPDGSYDLVAQYDGDVSNLVETILPIKLTTSKYDFGNRKQEVANKNKVKSKKAPPLPLIDIALATLKL